MRKEFLMLVIILISIVLFASCKTNNTDNNDITDKEIINLFNKAEELYKIADGVCSEDYIYNNNDFYRNGDENDISLNMRINEYSDCFTKKECEEIFSGERYKDNIVYFVYPYGVKNDDTIEKINIEQISSDDISDYTSITLFSIVRGENVSYAANHLEIVGINPESIDLKLTALYISNTCKESDECIIEYMNNDWFVIPNEQQKESYKYILQDNDYIKEYYYKLVIEDGLWKFDNFELWY